VASEALEAFDHVRATTWRLINRNSRASIFYEYRTLLLLTAAAAVYCLRYEKNRI
jgi:hypothetical protein